MRAADLAYDLLVAIIGLAFAIGAPLGVETIRFLLS